MWCRGPVRYAGTGAVGKFYFCSSAAWPAGPIYHPLNYCDTVRSTVWEGSELKPAKNGWPDGSASKMMLFIAQSLREMLTPTSYESFRVSTLDLKSRLIELIVLTRDVSQERVPPVSLEPALKELKTSLSHDIVAEELLSNEIELFKSKWPADIKLGAHITELERFLVSLTRKVDGTYTKSLQQKIIDLSVDAKDKEKIRSTLNIFCSNLINEGYSRQHILRQVEGKFFSGDIKKIERRTLSSFFSTFDFLKRNYVVTVPVSTNLASYIRKISLTNFVVTKSDELDEGTKASLQSRSPLTAHRYIQIKTSQLDEYSALRFANDALSSVVAMTYLGKKNVVLNWEQYGHIKKERSRSGILLDLENIALQKHSPVLGRGLANTLKTQTKQILQSFTTESTERVFNTINMASLSQTFPRPENQIITLWSAIETLLSDPPRGTARVVHYVDSLTPCICSKYVRRYLIGLFDDLRANYPKHTKAFFRRGEFDQNIDPYTNFTKLIFDPAMKGLHRQFCQPLAQNPLALYRLWKAEKNFNDPKSFLKSLEQHELRVRWQLHRIYRVRNHIVHSGQIPRFLDPIVLNTYEYLRSAIGPILGRASSAGRRSSINQVVSEIGFEYAMMKSSLKSKAEFSTDDIIRYYK